MTQWDRSNVLAQTEFGAELWYNLLMSDICRWVPDMNGHFAPLHSWRCRGVRERFGMSPLEAADIWLAAKVAAATRVGITALATRTDPPTAGLQPRWPQPHEWVPQLETMHS